MWLLLAEHLFSWLGFPSFSEGFFFFLPWQSCFVTPFSKIAMFNAKECIFKCPTFIVVTSLWRLLHYRLPEYLTTTSLLEPKLHWFSWLLLDKGDEFYWIRSHGRTSQFPALKVKDSFNFLLLSLSLHLPSLSNPSFSHLSFDLFFFLFCLTSGHHS